MVLGAILSLAALDRGQAQLSPRDPADLILRITVAPAEALPCEPIAVYVSLTNAGLGPCDLWNTLNWERELISLSAMKDRQEKIVLLPRSVGCGGEALPAYRTVRPGESLRWKLWVVRGYPDDRAGTGVVIDPAGHKTSLFAFDRPGQYEIHVNACGTLPDKAGESTTLTLRAEVAGLTLRSPDAEERRAIELLRQRRPPSLPPGGQFFWETNDAAEMLLQELRGDQLPDSTGLRHAKGVHPVSATIAQFRQLYTEFFDTPYAAYAAIVLARWEAREFDWEDFRKPADFLKAAQILESLQDRTLTPALREEVLALQAQVYLFLGRWADAENCLKKLEAMDPAEPLKSLIPQIRERKKQLMPLSVALP